MGRKCGQFAEPLISGYLDGVLASGDWRRTRLHLRQCPDCRRLLGDLREIRTAMMSTRWRPLAGSSTLSDPSLALHGRICVSR